MERASEIQRERGGGGYTSYSPALPASPGFGIFRQCSSSPSLGATVRHLPYWDMWDPLGIHLPYMAGAAAHEPRGFIIADVQRSRRRPPSAGWRGRRLGPRGWWRVWRPGSEL